jgi:hypothetical protein
MTDDTLRCACGHLASSHGAYACWRCDGCAKSNTEVVRDGDKEHLSDETLQRLWDEIPRLVQPERLHVRLVRDLRRARELLQHFVDCDNNECDRRDEATAFLGGPETEMKI